jgi:hypothetical protein
MPKYYVAVRTIEMSNGQSVHHDLKAYETEGAALQRIQEEQENVGAVLDAELCRTHGDMMETFGGMKLRHVFANIGIKGLHCSVRAVDASDLDLIVPPPSLLKQ